MATLFRPGLCLGAGLLLTACAVQKPIATQPYPSSKFYAVPVDISDLPGWNTDSTSKALPALLKSCQYFDKKEPEFVIGKGDFARTASDWQHVCNALKKATTDDTVREALNDGFSAYQITAINGDTKGTFTGYYEAEMNGSMFYSPYYPYPVYGKPIDLVTRTQNGARVTGRLKKGEVTPYPTRAEIESGALESLAPILFWVDDLVDLHIAQIQGSSQVSLPDGKKFRIGYAGNNGHQFKGLGRILLDAKLIQPGKASMPEIRKWLHSYPRQAERLMWENPRFIFFRMIEGDGPVGAMGLPLTAKRSMAVDPEVIPLGAPIWLQTEGPDHEPLKRLMVAQDIGSAIKGAVRGDFFWGSGKAAFDKAGRMKSQGQYYVMIPTIKTMPEFLPKPEPVTPKKPADDAKTEKPAEGKKP